MGNSGLDDETGSFSSRQSFLFGVRLCLYILDVDSKISGYAFVYNYHIVVPNSFLFL